MKKKKSSLPRPATATTAQVRPERPIPSSGPPRAGWNRSPLSASCSSDSVELFEGSSAQEEHLFSSSNGRSEARSLL